MKYGARGGTRTPTLLPAADFESAASTDSATRAKGWLHVQPATEAAHYPESWGCPQGERYNRAP